MARVEHVDDSGADLFHHGVPLTEDQFRHAVQRISVLAGTFPNAFPNIGDVDEAWAWYAASNYYVTRGQPRPYGTLVTPWRRRWRGAKLAPGQLDGDHAS